MHFQIQSRLLDGAILSFIDEESLYGHTIAKRVRLIFAVSDSSIYPVLNRLKNSSLLLLIIIHIMVVIAVTIRLQQQEALNYTQLLRNGGVLAIKLMS